MAVAVILVLEDHVETNNLVCRLIRRGGHEPVRALWGEEALSLIIKSKPAFVILDQSMPAMESLEVLRRLRMNCETARVPVVMYTAVGDLGFADQPKRLGATDVWVKGSFSP